MAKSAFEHDSERLPDIQVLLVIPGESHREEDVTVSPLHDDYKLQFTGFLMSLMARALDKEVEQARREISTIYRLGLTDKVEIDELNVIYEAALAERDLPDSEKLQIKRLPIGKDGENIQVFPPDYRKLGQLGELALDRSTFPNTIHH